MTRAVGVRNVEPFIEPGYEICLACPRYRCEPDAKDCPLKLYHKSLGRYWWNDVREAKGNGNRDGLHPISG